jgi:rfaE bifunctional protein kinase chain/domain
VLRLDRQPSELPDEKLIAALRERLIQVDREVDAWVASDYGYGSFDAPLREVLREIAGRKPVLADSRWDLTRFAGLTLVKPNEEEARAAAAALGVTATDEGMLATELASRLEARAVLVTLGNKGMVLSTQGRVARIEAVGTEEIVDLTGAGDSVAATLAAAIAVGIGFEIAARLANHAGSIVVMKEGAATASPQELCESIMNHGE